MKFRNVIIVLWLGVIALVIASLGMAAQAAQAQTSCSDPFGNPVPCPNSGGGGGKKRPTAIPPTATSTSTPTSTPTATQPFSVLMPISGGGGTPQSLEPTSTATLDPKIVAMIETAACATTFAATPQSKFLYLCWSPTPTPCVLCPLPSVPPTKVAGPVFLRPGVINMIIAGLVVLVAGALIIVFRNR